MNRRRALKTTAVVLAVPATATQLAGCAPGRLEIFRSWGQAQQAVLDLLFHDQVVQGSDWNLSQVLQHLSQGIEFSMQGFPQLRGAWFRHSLGAAVFGVFNARGKMSHSLDEPIPGAPALDASLALRAAVNRLLAAMDVFAEFKGTLHPHFAYGELTRPQYERAHLMHLASHWAQFRARTAVASDRRHGLARDNAAVPDQRPT